jgi:hypothetical protein
MVETEQATRDDLLKHIAEREAIPTVAEQRLINKHSADLLRIFDMD